MQCNFSAYLAGKDALLLHIFYFQYPASHLFFGRNVSRVMLTPVIMPPVEEIRIKSPHYLFDVAEPHNWLGWIVIQLIELLNVKMLIEPVDSVRIAADIFWSMRFISVLVLAQIHYDIVIQWTIDGFALKILLF